MTKAVRNFLVSLGWKAGILATVLVATTGDGKREGPSQPSPLFDFLHKVSEWNTKDAPLLSIYTNDSALQELAFDVFAYQSVDAFVADLHRWGSNEA